MILITIISLDYLNFSLANEYVGDVTILLKVCKYNQCCFGGSANQMAVLPQIKLYLYHMKKHPTRIIYMCIHLNIYFIVKRVLRQVPLVKLEVHTLPDHLLSTLRFTTSDYSF